jgi:hypothetical protein
VASRRKIVFRWDLDKTYLVSNFESLRSLVRVPFERARDKVAIPGAAPVIRGLRRGCETKGFPTYVHFLTASPPQIGSAIREKLTLDGVIYDGITFKDQVTHIVRGRFDALREQIGYKLSRLLRSALEHDHDVYEFLFGDDWESDPFVYSLYADIVARKIGAEPTLTLLRSARVNPHYLSAIERLLAEPFPRMTVLGIFVLRQRKRESGDLSRFGGRLTWFDNYVECALGLYHVGLLDEEAVLDVIRDSGLAPEGVHDAFEAVIERGHVPREALGVVAGAVGDAHLSLPVDRGNPLKRLAYRVRRGLRGGWPSPRSQTALPDYEALVADWSRQARREP